MVDFLEFGLLDADDPLIIRERKRQEAIDLRIARFGSCKCDLCGIRPGVEYHEIVSRWRTMPDKQVRLRSFEPPICSMLCRQCHDQIAPTVAGRRQLLEFNVQLYGYFVVRATLEAIPKQFRSDIRMPEYRHV